MKFNTSGKNPHIILIVPRGEAVRNFLYSDTLAVLAKHARVTILSVITDERFIKQFRPYAQIEPLLFFNEHRVVRELRTLIHEAHFKWLWSKVAQNVWELRTFHATTSVKKLRWTVTKHLAAGLAFRPALEKLTLLENKITVGLRPDDHFIRLFHRLQPDLVFNCSHIHGPAGSLPVRIAHQMGIPTAGFIFSWDNLTSRSRIFEPYDYYLVWHEQMKRQLISIYPGLDENKVFITGTPQFDFHFKPEFLMSRKDLCARMGIDPARPFIFYSTGMDNHFPGEHRHVKFIAEYLQNIDIKSRPQLLVRTYAKGTSAEMKAMAQNPPHDVIFPKVKWDEKWFIPAYEDLSEYSSCLYHCAMGINPASTVSLELMMLDKPVMNIGFDPPGTSLPNAYRWERHIHFDHYKQVADSGGVMVARSLGDIGQMILRSLKEPSERSATRQRFVNRTFGKTLDGKSGQRVAGKLLSLSEGKNFK